MTFIIYQIFTNILLLFSVGNRILNIEMMALFQGFGAMPWALGGAADSAGSGAGGGENITLSQFGFLSGPDPRN